MVREDGEADEQQARDAALQQRGAQRHAGGAAARVALQQHAHHAERQRAQRPGRRAADAAAAHGDAAYNATNISLQYCRSQFRLENLVSSL